ncbi:unnamed protein product, partial [Penicillium viridicatum]
MRDKKPDASEQGLRMHKLRDHTALRHRYPITSSRRFKVLVFSALLFIIPFGCLFRVPIGISGIWKLGHRFETWQRDSLSHGELQDILRSTPDESKLSEWSRYYTSGPHLAGKNLSQAHWTRDRWREFGVADANIVTYDVYLNYPNDRRLALISHNEKDRDVLFEASLEENILEEDGTTCLENRVPTFHAYSGSGNVTASYVFVNYGTYDDFEELLDIGITLAGKIALIKYGHVFRGLKVQRAEELGMVGVVLYSDPGDDGEVTEANGYDPYPFGMAREPSSVQRGSTLFMTKAQGDPTTPGYPSKPGAPRQSVDGRIPSIPSIPISYVDALPLLLALNGHGPNASSMNDRWSGGGLKQKGVHYNVGPSPPELNLHLVNDQNYVITPIWNVIGIINGSSSDEVVIIGNHRDSWTAGGAGDPNSGSAALNEVVRGLGKALQAGWTPLRTIVVASWDGEEYGIIGSTEWVEEYLPWLSESAVAYINVDAGTAGPYFFASASPLLESVIINVTHSVPSPNQTEKGQMVGDVWDRNIMTIGSGSDFVAFQDFAGIPSLDMGFNHGPGGPVYHYHSNYDSWYWMDRFGDPGWHYHATMAKLWGLLTLELVELPVIPFKATDYANALARYAESLEKIASNSTVGVDLISFKHLKSALS